MSRTWWPLFFITILGSAQVLIVNIPFGQGMPAFFVLYNNRGLLTGCGPFPQAL
jgi:hypothetical protein